MNGRKHVDGINAITFCLSVAESWQWTEWISVGDSWFGSVNSVKELINKNG